MQGRRASPPKAREPTAFRICRRRSRAICGCCSFQSATRTWTCYLTDYEISTIARSLKVSVAWLFSETEDRR
jgi:RNA polymerase subunit RPABC4/transcription elongation factor Spt4